MISSVFSMRWCCLPSWGHSIHIYNMCSSHMTLASLKLPDLTNKARFRLETAHCWETPPGAVSQAPVRKWNMILKVWLEEYIWRPFTYNSTAQGPLVMWRGKLQPGKVMAALFWSFYKSNQGYNPQILACILNEFKLYNGYLIQSSCSLLLSAMY